jgi:uncharacterized protein (TIGR02596 family)
MNSSITSNAVHRCPAHNAIQRSQSGFTLIELMVVISIIALIAALSIPTVNLGAGGTGLVGTADKLEGQFAFAKQSAQSDNKTVQMRFFNYSNPDDGQYEKKFRGYQLFYIDKDGNDKALGEFVALPAPLIITASPEFSTLVQPGLDVLGAEEIPVGAESNITADFVGFNFRPSGDTNLRTTVAQKWYVTILDEALDPQVSGAGLPTDFITLMIDPFNGRVTRWTR